MARVKYFDPVTESWKYADRRSGSDKKSAYEYALDGGYTGTEEEFAAKMAAENPGIHTGPEEPTDDSVFWIDTDEDPEDMPNGGNVSYEEAQNLTDAQKAQARENIGAQPSGNYLTEVPEGYAKTEDVPTEQEIIQLIEEHTPESSGGGIAVTGAKVGQTVKITAVDDNGVPTAWEAVDFPSEEEYELIETIVCDGTFGNIRRTNLSLKKAKIFLNMKAASSAVTVCIEAYNESGLFGYARLGNMINTGERFASAYFVSDGKDAYTEFINPAALNYNTGSVSRTAFPQNADTPINKISIYVSSDGIFPAESTIEIWGVRA